MFAFSPLLDFFLILKRQLRSLDILKSRVSWLLSSPSPYSQCPPCLPQTSSTAYAFIQRMICSKKLDDDVIIMLLVPGILWTSSLLMEGRRKYLLFHIFCFDSIMRCCYFIIFKFNLCSGRNIQKHVILWYPFIFIFYPNTIFFQWDPYILICWIKLM